MWRPGCSTARSCRSRWASSRSAIAVVLGLLLGLPAGYFGGKVDMIVMRAMDVMLAFPSILLALSVVSLLGPSLGNAMIAVGISVVPVYVRLVRASALQTRDHLFIEAARVVGVGHVAIMVRHLLPERARAAGRGRDARRRDGDHRGRVALVPRPRRPAADARVGRDAQRGPRLHPDRLVAHRLSRASRS